MHIVPWNEKLTLGIEIVDEQHYEFLKRANKFIIKYLAEKKEEAVKEELEYLQDYLQYHFQTEETFQYESIYPDYLKHQAEHKQLIFRVKEMTIKLLDMENREMIMKDFADFIQDWVINHILTSDLKFANYYNKNKK